MPARRKPKHPDARLVPPAQPSALCSEAKNALSDAKARELSNRLKDLISALETVRIATQIGLPCHPRWRYKTPGAAGKELRELAKYLDDISREYPE